MTERVLITGGAGFAGHHVVEHFLKNTDMEILVIDKLTYAAAGYDRLRDIEVFDTKRVQIYTPDFTKPISPGVAKELGKIDYILHLGAETHVDNSIINPEPFVRTNVVGTMHMLDYARTLDSLKLFVYFSTDEVFGPALNGEYFEEWDRYNSSNPYAATKAAGEELALAYANTYRIPVLITHTMNLFGERQHPEKFIPKVINAVLANEIVPIHSNSAKTQAGSRFYIHCRNMADALLFLINYYRAPAGFSTSYAFGIRDKINIVGELEVDNLSMAQFIAKVVGKPLKYELVDFHSSRPGHDLRYALDGKKLSDMGWEIPVDFYESLEKTIRWSLENPRWLNWETE